MRIFSATCENNVVTADDAVIQNCPIMGEGGASSGYLVISESDLFYLPKTTPDVKSLISQLENFSSKLESLCDKIAAITVICTGPGGTSSVPVNALDFGVTKSELAEIHSNLTTLKDALK